MEKITILIPVYNEVKTLEQMVDKVEKTDFCGLEKEIILDQKIKEYEIGRSDTDKIINERLEGTDGWEAFDVKHYDYGLMIFLKRKYIEVNNDN